MEDALKGCIAVWVRRMVDLITMRAALFLPLTACAAQSINHDLRTFDEYRA